MNTLIWQYTRLQTERPLGGVEMHIQQMSLALQALGAKVAIGAANVPRADRIIIHSHGDCALPPALPRELRAGGAEIVYVPFFHGTTAGRMLACREFLSPSGLRASAREFWTCLRADAAVAVSRIAEKEARRYYLFRKSVAVIPNGIDPKIFKPIEKIASPRQILFVGRGSDRVKNLDRILSASELVWKRHSDFKILLVPGEKKSSPFSESLGHKNSSELAALFKSCRALVLGSLYEADPIVLREAQAAGLPVLASDIAQLKTSLAGYVNAFYFDPRNSGDIAQKIEQVVYESALTPHSSVRTWESAARELLLFYKSLGFAAC